LERAGHPARVIRVEDRAGLHDALARIGGVDGVHLNFTDRLFGLTPRAAAEQVVDVVRHVGAAGARVTVTLHDVPQPADGGNYPQRTAAYRTVCDAVDGRATNSEHERKLLAENGITDAADVVVIPLPLDLGHHPTRRPVREQREVAVLGFVYPGKGHAEVIAAMAGLAPDVGFLAIGECSAGHADLSVRLTESARAFGRTFALTGYVPNHALSGALRQVSVPVAHHRHVSASGSLNTWIAAHRRPLVPANRYTEEHAGRHPETLQLYQDTKDGLATAMEAALADPESTWLPAGAASGSPPELTARLYVEAFARWHG
ncbi:MAG: hypothetical protein M3O32_12730, partial [Actinomycetota bacterium]|nr:hypothetical protein [Actinomycetota bacterium]